MVLVPVSEVSEARTSDKGKEKEGRWEGVGREERGRFSVCTVEHLVLNNYSSHFVTPVLSSSPLWMEKRSISLEQLKVLLYSLLSSSPFLIPSLRLNVLIILFLA